MRIRIFSIPVAGIDIHTWPIQWNICIYVCVLNTLVNFNPLLPDHYIIALTCIKQCSNACSILPKQWGRHNTKSLLVKFAQLTNTLYLCTTRDFYCVFLCSFYCVFTCAVCVWLSVFVQSGFDGHHHTPFWEWKKGFEF